MEMEGFFYFSVSIHSIQALLARNDHFAFDDDGDDATVTTTTFFVFVFAFDPSPSLDFQGVNLHSSSSKKYQNPCQSVPG